MFYNKQFLHPKSQAGQAIVLLTLMMIVLLGAVGFAIDGGQAYYYSTRIEIAAPRMRRWRRLI
jgi:Flp pilus assembly protein TadG